MGGELTGRRAVVCHHAGVWPWSGIYLVLGAALFFTAARDLSQPSGAAMQVITTHSPPRHVVSEALPPPTTVHRDGGGGASATVTLSLQNQNPNHRFFAEDAIAMGANTGRVLGDSGGSDRSMPIAPTTGARKSNLIAPVPTAKTATITIDTAAAGPEVSAAAIATPGTGTVHTPARPGPARPAAIAAASGHIAMMAMDGSGKWVTNAADRLRDIACTLRQTPGVTVSFFLQVSADGYDANPIAEWNAAHNVCNGTAGKAFDPFEVTRDPPFAERKNAPKKRGHQDPGKIHRLAVFRDHFRDELRSRFAKADTATPDVVVLVDGDLMSFPAADAIQRAIAAVQRGGEQPWQALCANGRAGHHWHERYYDTFATVLKNGSYPYHDIYVHHQKFPQSTKSNDDMYQSLFAFVDVQTKGCTRGSHGSVCQNGDNIIPQEVRSCFGGLTVYAGSAYFEPTCRYQDAALAEVYNPADWHTTIRAPCEHVVLHLCLSQRTPFRIAVAPDMMTFWGGT